MKKSIDSEKILILDFGSQYTQLIARRVREIGVFSEIVSHQISYKEIKKNLPNGIILSGGPESVYAKKTLTLDPEILNSNIPILGICYGMQLIAQHFQGKVKTSKKSEFGNTSITLYRGKIFQKIFNKDLELKHHTSGKPFIKEAKYLSISHSSNFLALAFGDENIGIDIEKPQNRMIKLIPKVLSEIELMEFKKESAIDLACKLWGTK